MTVTLEQLKTWSDEKILTFVKNEKRDGVMLQDAWNETAHPEYLFQAFYDDVMRHLYTPEEYERLYAEIEDLMDLEDGLTKEEFLEDNVWLWEDAGELAPDINPKYQKELDLYIFKYLADNEGWGDKFLLDFVNDEL